DRDNFYVTVYNNVNSSLSATFQLYIVDKNGNRINLLKPDQLPFWIITRGLNVFNSEAILAKGIFVKENLLKGETLIGVEMNYVFCDVNIKSVITEMNLTELNGLLYSSSNKADEYVTSTNNRISKGASVSATEKESICTKGIMIEKEQDPNASANQENEDKVEEHSDDAYAAGGSFILNADNLETGLMDVTESIDIELLERLNNMQAISKIKYIINEIDHLKEDKDELAFNNKKPVKAKKPEPMSIVEKFGIADSQGQDLRAEMAEVYRELMRLKKKIASTDDIHMKLNEMQHIKKALNQLIYIHQSMINKTMKLNPEEGIEFVGN
ncbi:MAG: hypothetical protein KA797_09640, partial [Chitinophagales bacterium]|nr:hypothetical protein [Chitinophagales bacterium]